MAKRYAGLTEYRWRKQMEFMIADHKIPFAGTCGQCYSWRRMLIHNGDWDNFPKDLKWNLQLYASIYEREMYPDLRENHAKQIEERIQQLEIEKQRWLHELSVIKQEGV